MNTVNAGPTCPHPPMARVPLDGPPQQVICLECGRVLPGKS